MNEANALRHAHAIVNTWDNWPNFDDESRADDALQTAIGESKSAMGCQFEEWFKPAWDWQSDNNPNDYLLDEACAVLRVFLKGGRDCDIPAILKAEGYR